MPLDKIKASFSFEALTETEISGTNGRIFIFYEFNSCDANISNQNANLHYR